MIYSPDRKKLDQELKLQDNKINSNQESPKFFSSILNAIKIDFAGKIKNLFTKEHQTNIESDQTNNIIIPTVTTNFMKEVGTSYNIPIYPSTAETINMENIISFSDIIVAQDKQSHQEVPNRQQKLESPGRLNMDKKIDPFDNFHMEHDNSTYQIMNYQNKTYSLMPSPNIKNKFKVDEAQEEPESLIHIDDYAAEDIRDNLDAESHNSNVDVLNGDLDFTSPTRRNLMISPENRGRKELNSAEKSPSPGLEIGSLKTLIIRPTHKEDYARSVSRNLLFDLEFMNFIE